jgi:hypothetical protein
MKKSELGRELRQLIIQRDSAILNFNACTDYNLQDAFYLEQLSLERKIDSLIRTAEKEQPYTVPPAKTINNTLQTLLYTMKGVTSKWQRNI